MSTELPKTYEPAAVENETYATWQNERAFHAEPSDPGKPYAVVIPPPNVTAALHLGHALNNTLQDILIRQRRMAGDNAVWLPGTDHAGIATQTVVEKRVLAEEGKRRTEFPRDVFVGKIQAWKDEYEARITDQLKRMGCSCDWDRQAFTMDEPRAKAVREAFYRLFRDGLIYRGKRLVNWDPATQTALADDEVEMEEVDGHFYYLRYPLAKTGPKGETCITVATTRPETMLGDTAVAVNPKDAARAHLIGQTIRLPIVNREIPIIGDDYVVVPDPESDDPKARFASGFLKVTPAHDPNDYDIGQRHKLPIINVMAPDGTISDKYGWPTEDCAAGEATLVLGLDRYEARKVIVDWFRKNGLLEEVKPYRHTVGHSYRSHVPIEPYLSDQWYVATTKAPDLQENSDIVPGTNIAAGSLAGLALRAMNTEQVDGDFESIAYKHWEGQLKFFPARYSRTFQTWHENIRDWCISRQLWWGHRIPVWHFKNDSAVDSQSDSEVTSLMERLMSFRNQDRLVIQHECLDKPDRASIDLQHAFICVREDDAEVIDVLHKLGFEQDTDVLDTWFSSALWPLSTLGWPANTPDLAKWNPSHTLCTAREIITLWVSRMVMFNLYFRDELPFKDVFIHAMIQDGLGRKMSKSLGNGVDPLDIIHSHGADAMRFTLADMATNTQDVRMPVERDEATGRNTSPKFDIGRNFCNKLWNAARFALMNLQGTREAATAAALPQGDLLTDWIQSRLSRAVQTANEALADYRFDQYAKACYDFFWRDFCDWYLEAIKPAMRDPQRTGPTARMLGDMLSGALRLLHPAVPYITETIWPRLSELRPDQPNHSKLLIHAPWPEAGAVNESAEQSMAMLQEIVIAIRNVRGQHNVPPKQKVTVSIATAPQHLATVQNNREFIELLAACTLSQVGETVTEPADAARASAAGCELFIEGAVDRAADQQRIEKRRAELTKQIGTLKGRLANEKYVSSAPPALVNQTRQQLADAETELARLA